MEKVLKLNNKYFLLIWAFTLSYELKRISYHTRLSLVHKQLLFIFQGFRIRGSYATFLRFQSLIMFGKLKYESKNNSSPNNGYRLHSSRTTG